MAKALGCTKVVLDSRAGQPGVALTVAPGQARLAGVTVTHAAKPYICCECGAPIIARHRHQTIRVLSGVKWYQFRSCLPCARVRADLFINPGKAFTLTNLWNDVIELYWAADDTDMSWLK